MTEIAVRPLPGAATDTQPGNYFISNYPPFSFWATEGIEDARRAFAEPAPGDTPLGLYVHIPFCRKRCHFCYFKVYTDKNSSAIQRYIDALIAEAHRYSEQAFVRGRSLDYVYFGGGTPSFLSTDQLTRLIGGLKAAFSWDRVQEVAFECEPGTLSESKVHALRDLGVTRLSLGVESFDDRVLATNG
ncbi:MAG: radical SAM protein, partial [Candidatus Omnitrophica bacterium]|nr:radical SAM protein [Candidatus Omnitrophota bacterium]